MGSPPPRVARDENLPDLVPADDSDSDDKDEENESDRLVVACLRAVVSPFKAQVTPLPTIPDYRKYTTQDEDISPSARNTRDQITILSVMGKVMLSCCQMSRTSYQIDPRKSASRKHLLEMFCEMAGAVLNEETGDLLDYCNLIKKPQHKEVWGGSFGKEVGHLAQGLSGIVEDTGIFDLIFKHEIPDNRLKYITYARSVCNHRPENKDTNRCRITIGGNLTNYTGIYGTPTAKLLFVTILLNIVISTKGNVFMILDISNCF